MSYYVEAKNGHKLRDAQMLGCLSIFAGLEVGINIL